MREKISPSPVAIADTTGVGRVYPTLLPRTSQIAVSRRTNPRESAKPSYESAIRFGVQAPWTPDGLSLHAAPTVAQFCHPGREPLAELPLWDVGLADSHLRLTELEGGTKGANIPALVASVAVEQLSVGADSDREVVSAAVGAVRAGSAASLATEVIAAAFKQPASFIFSASPGGLCPPCRFESPFDFFS